MRITATPARPVVGAVVTLRLQTFEPVARPEGGVGPGEPIRLGLPQQMLYLGPPRGEEPVGLDLRRRRDDGSIWERKFVFTRAGIWNLRSIDETAVSPACRGRLRLRVSGR